MTVKQGEENESSSCRAQLDTGADLLGRQEVWTSVRVAPDSVITAARHAGGFEVRPIRGAVFADTGEVALLVNETEIGRAPRAKPIVLTMPTDSNAGWGSGPSID